MSSIASKRQLNVKISLGAINVLKYPDKLATNSGATPSISYETGANPIANSANITQPDRIKSYSGGFILSPNPDINSPFNTFVYGSLTNNTGFNLLSPPPDSQQLSFPFSSFYGSLISNATSEKTFSLTADQQISSSFSSPTMPSFSSLGTVNTPILNTYNFWGFVNPDNSFATSGVTYQRGADPIYSSTWAQGKITQNIDQSNQAVISVDASNNNPVNIRRMFFINKDVLYDNQATLLYPTSSNINPVTFNQRDGKRIINPVENCGFMLSFDVKYFAGTATQSGNTKGIKIKFGNLDGYVQSTKSSVFIDYYEIVINENANPVLRFWHPQKQAFNELSLTGAQLTTGVNKVYVHFSGSVLLIGFNELTYSWNAIGPVEPNENENFDLLYHFIPGGREDQSLNSNIQVEFSNLVCDFKYSAIAFKNISQTVPTTPVDFFSTDADDYKRSFSHQTTVSTTFAKKISQTTRLSDFFNAKACRLLERINNTPQYIKKTESTYGFPTEIMLSNVQRNLTGVSFARDWRMQDPYADDFNNSNHWEIKAKIDNPNYDTIVSNDQSTPSTISATLVFDNPIYSPVFLELNTLTMPVNDLSLASETNINTSKATAMSILQDTQTSNYTSSSNSIDASYTDPIFYFDGSNGGTGWGDITDLVPTSSINITHSIGDKGLATSTCSLQLKDLIYSSRGANILNYIENNVTVIRIAIAYDGVPLDSSVYFEGVINSITTLRSPTESTHTLNCSDWLNTVLNNTLAAQTVSLQGIDIKSRLNLALRLAALEQFVQYWTQNRTNLPGPDGINDPSLSDNDKDFITALNFRQGNSSGTSSSNALSSQIEITTPCAQIATDTLSFILDDLAIPVMYQNISNVGKIDPANNALDQTLSSNNRIIVENRYLATKYIDTFKYLTTVTSDGLISNSLSDLNLNSFATDGTNILSQLHGVITTPIQSTSSPSALYEGVYLFAQGLGSVPLYQVRSSDSYVTQNNYNQSNSDFYLYFTAMNSQYNILGATFTVLDQINSTPFNNDNTTVTATKIGVGGYNYGYVGFRKRFQDNDSQNAIQTAQDLQKRGDLWAQYIRRVVQNIQFTAIVTKPLNHYNNFLIAGMGKNVPLDTANLAMDRSEFTKFLYSTTTYNINKELNLITATVAGGIVPKFSNTLTTQTTTQ